MEMHVHPKYSPRAKAFSLRLLPDGPTIKTLRTITVRLKLIRPLTLGFLKLFDKVIKGLVGSLRHDILEEVLHQLVDLILLKV
jgi:hypothetical protein